jgi:hypothetical protein
MIRLQLLFNSINLFFKLTIRYFFLHVSHTYPMVNFILFLFKKKKKKVVRVVQDLYKSCKRIISLNKLGFPTIRVPKVHPQRHIEEVKLS